MSGGSSKPSRESGGVNEALRSHVTRVGFDLTLGRTHVAALVYIDVMIRASRLQRGAYIDTHAVTDITTRRAFNHFAGGASGLIGRGLVVHHYAGRGKAFHRHYTITKAGRLVIGLLKESGLYDEYAAMLPAATDLDERAS